MQDRRCDNCGWYISGIAFCRTDGVLTEDYEWCDSWKPKTIADDVRQMSDEDLADLLSNTRCCECPMRYKCDGREEVDIAKCYKYWLHYLKSEKSYG